MKLCLLHVVSTLALPVLGFVLTGIIDARGVALFLIGPIVLIDLPLSAGDWCIAAAGFGGMVTCYVVSWRRLKIQQRVPWLAFFGAAVWVCTAFLLSAGLGG